MVRNKSFYTSKRSGFYHGKHEKERYYPLVLVQVCLVVLGYDKLS